MKLKISELKPNPFKKYINEGKLNENIIEKLIEGFEQTRFHENLCARENEKGEYELIYGHHRAEAVKRYYGKDYLININVYSYKNFTDEQMLIDMVRENLTQRDTDFHDTEDSVILAKRWLEGNFVKGLYKIKKTEDNPKGAGRPQEPADARKIALFLSKNGKAVSFMQISKYLNIAENLDKEIHDKISKGIQGHTQEGKIGLELGAKLAQFENKEEQKELYEITENIMSDEDNKEGLSEEKVNKLLTKYKQAPDEIKQKVREGEISLIEVEQATIEKQIKDNNKDVTTTFIPNFESRLKNFDYNVVKLEQQVAIFRKVFGSNNFQTKYHNLGNKEKRFLDDTIYDIQKRIKKCYDEVEYFITKIEDR